MVRVATPQMADDTDVRIVTNAALNEVVGRYDGTKHEYEVDLSKGIVLYHESQKLASSAYQNQIEERIRQIGFDAQVLRVGLNPSPEIMTDKGPVRMWPDRVTAIIEVPEMRTNTDANRVVDAIAYARLGGDDPRVQARRSTRSITVTYEGLLLADQNVEYAIACVGYNANAVPANLGTTDSVPQGWSPLRL